VDPGAYPADLAGYVVEGGSEKCALSMGVVIDAYVKACPKAKIAVTGWR
jgi:cutinase